MSCNGCRVLRRGCSEQCILRPCLEWIKGTQAQGYATLFVSKFFGRSDLMSFISVVPESKRPALFQSLLFEACGRTVNPVNGAVGLLSTGNWHICQAAVETVLAGGVPRPVPFGILPPNAGEEAESLSWGSRLHTQSKQNPSMQGSMGFFNGESMASVCGSLDCMEHTASFASGISEASPEFGTGVTGGGSKMPNFSTFLVNNGAIANLEGLTNWVKRNCNVELSCLLTFSSFMSNGKQYLFSFINNKLN